MKKLLLLIFAIILISSGSCKYNEDTASYLWDLCRMSYCGYSIIEEMKCGAPCDTIHNYISNLTLIHGHDSQLAIVFWNKQDKHMYLIYRGTDNIPGWFKDFEMLQKDYDKCEGCKIHQGFQDITQDLISDITTKLTSLSKEYNTKKLIITGHSLGAALAYLGAAELYNEFEIEKLYTYGCPRIGNEHFAKWYDTLQFQETFRIVNEKDIITHNPMELLGYRHVNTEVWYYDTKKMEYKICEKMEDPKCSDSSFWLSMIDHGGYMNRSVMFDTHMDGSCNPLHGGHLGVENLLQKKNNFK